MTIYVDDPMPTGGKFHNYSHMWTDENTSVLVDFAKRLGLNPTWLQHSRGASGDFYHFDISPRYRAKALKAGAVCMDLREWLKTKPKTTVANVRDPFIFEALHRGDPHYVYCGRSNIPRRLAESKWANPFKVGKDGNRQQVIEKFEEYLLGNQMLIQALPELRAKVLVCWCAPEACHCDVLAHWADKTTK